MRGIGMREDTGAQGGGAAPGTVGRRRCYVPKDVPCESRRMRLPSLLYFHGVDRGTGRGRCASPPL